MAEFPVGGQLFQPPYGCAISLPADVPAMPANADIELIAGPLPLNDDPLDHERQDCDAVSLIDPVVVPEPGNVLCRGPDPVPFRLCQVPNRINRAFVVDIHKA